jgi:hypothetical protein
MALARAEAQIGRGGELLSARRTSFWVDVIVFTHAPCNNLDRAIARSTMAPKATEASAGGLRVITLSGL